MDKIFQAINELLKTCVELLGYNLTVVLIFLVPSLLFLYKVYNDWTKRREVNLAIKAKDETIQVLAEQNRQFRVIELKEKGWNDDAINNVVMKNTPKDAVEARKMLQESKPGKVKKTSNKGRKK